MSDTTSTLAETTVVAGGESLRSLIPLPLKNLYRAIRLFMFMHLRFPVLRLLGYKTANPYCTAFPMFPAEKMERILESIFLQLNVGGFEVIVDHGCGDGTHYSRMLKRFSNEVWGVDILDAASVRNTDRYFRVPTEKMDSYFESVPDNTVDCVVVLSSMGMTHEHDWKANFEYKGSRQGRYFTAKNYPRILKVGGGYLVIVEWEAKPEKRFGKRNLQSVRDQMRQFYHYPEIPGCDVVLQGFSEFCNGPYIVYRKR